VAASAPAVRRKAAIWFDVLFIRKPTDSPFTASLSAGSFDEDDEEEPSAPTGS
jgi:hypothetical protein